jgi:putative colanic acid biosynthesis UDP-glucose lipid carrier transferase
MPSHQLLFSGSSCLAVVVLADLFRRVLSPLTGRLRLHGSDISRLQRLLDPLGVTLLFLLFLGREAWNHPMLPLQPWLWLLLSCLLLLPTSGIYASYRQRSLFTLMRRVTSGWVLVVTALLLLSYATKTTANFSRVDTSLWALYSWLLLLLNHVGLRKLLRWHRSQGGNHRTVVYWGGVDAVAAFAHELQQAPWMGMQLTAWFSPELISSDRQPAHLPPCGGSLNDMRQWLERNRVDRIVFSHVSRDGVGMEQVLRLFGDTALPVIYAPHWASAQMRFISEPIGNQPCIELWGGERSLIDRQVKRSLDLLLSTCGLLLLSPLLLVIAGAIALTSPGPVLFAQDRYGIDGRRFRILKFRTMHVLEPGDQQGLRQATLNDPRLTPIGGVLRRWSIDELPQLLNVLRGEMSMVGPRPHAVDHNEKYRRLIPGYMQRHAFKPGITGLAQVEGFRGETSSLDLMANRVDADLRYQRDWSLKLDIKILIKTLLLLRSPNAY